MSDTPDDPKKTAAEILAPVIEKARTAALADALRGSEPAPEAFSAPFTVGGQGLTLDDMLLIAEWKSCSAGLGELPFDA